MSEITAVVDDADGKKVVVVVVHKGVVVLMEMVHQMQHQEKRNSIVAVVGRKQLQLQLLQPLSVA